MISTYIARLLPPTPVLSTLWRLLPPRCVRIHLSPTPRTLGDLQDHRLARQRPLRGVECPPPMFPLPPRAHSVPRYFGWPPLLLSSWRGALNLDLAHERRATLVESCSLLQAPGYLPSPRSVNTSPAAQRLSCPRISAVPAHPLSTDCSCHARTTSHVLTDRARAPQVRHPSPLLYVEVYIFYGISRACLHRHRN